MELRPLFPLKRALRAFSVPPPASGGGESVAYRQSMLRRPPTVRRGRLPRQSCSFIGTVDRPVERFAWNGPPLRGAYTFLEVEGPSAHSNPSSFRILLALSDKLAEASLKYLKPKDFIYVRGPLGSYKKLKESGNYETFYKVIVEELNFVKHHRQIQKSMEPESSIEEESTTPISSEEEHTDHLHLWQVFFANPYEWWDNRQEKHYSCSPDFRHKDTHECLWLRPDDPPWVRRQLQLYDSNMTTLFSRTKVHEWKMKDLE